MLGDAIHRDNGNEDHVIPAPARTASVLPVATAALAVHVAFAGSAETEPRSEKLQRRLPPSPRHLPVPLDIVPGEPIITRPDAVVT